MSCQKIRPRSTPFSASLSMFKSWDCFSAASRNRGGSTHRSHHENQDPNDSKSTTPPRPSAIVPAAQRWPDPERSDAYVRYRTVRFGGRVDVCHRILGRIGSRGMRQLASFLERVQMRVDRAICVPHFHSEQRALLAATVRQYRPYTEKNPLDDPIALLYLITQAWGRRLDAQVERVAAFCSLYLLAADLLDDVQDEDLAGKPHAAAGAAVASNNAVALLCLALRELHESLEHESCEPQRHQFLELFGRISLLCVSGQHRDLTQAGARTRAEVLELQMAKTASVSLVVECGALLARCDASASAAYRELGRRLAGVVQVRDDLRDVFGKSDSPDLRGSKLTYPLACFLETAGEQQRSE